MAEPILENIANVIVTRLETILLVNGFPFDVFAVYRPSRRMREISPQHLSVMVLQGDSVRFPEYDFQGNPAALCYAVEFQISGFVRMSDRDHESFDLQVNRMGAALHAAICPDVNWRTFNSNAIDAELGDQRRFTPGEGDHQGVTLSLTVYYRVSETDPYEARP